MAVYLFSLSRRRVSRDNSRQKSVCTEVKPSSTEERCSWPRPKPMMPSISQDFRRWWCNVQVDDDILIYNVIWNEAPTKDQWLANSIANEWALLNTCINAYSVIFHTEMGGMYFYRCRVIFLWWSQRMSRLIMVNARNNMSLDPNQSWSSTQPGRWVNQNHWANLDNVLQATVGAKFLKSSVE